MITDINQLDFNKKYSYADYLTWQFKERVELIKGRLFKMSPAPSLSHQRVSGRLFAAFFLFLKKSQCEVFSAPFDVRFPKQEKDGKNIYDIVQPDLCIVCDSQKLDYRGCNGSPDLIVEILSKATSKKDLKEKYQLYEVNAVKEYWIVHPDEQTLQINVLNESGNYLPGKLLTCGEEATSQVIEGFVLDLNDIFDCQKTIG